MSLSSSSAGRILIAGGGPGGLTVALALQQAGYEPVIFERGSAACGGAAFTLWPNALQALEGLGIGDQLRACTTSFGGLAMLERNGSTLFHIGSDALQARFGFSGIALERERFIRILLDALGPVEIYYGATCVNFRQDQDSCTAILAGGKEVSGIAMIAADGLGSTIRAQMWNTTAPRFAGYSVFRGTCEELLEDKVAVTSMGRGLQFGYFPMADGRTYWFASTCFPDHLRNRGELPVGAALREFLPWHNPVPRLLERTAQQDIVQNDVFDMDPLPKWSKGRVTLLGDAAHPSTPDLGQGLCQAVEDAVVLADSLRKADSICAGLQAYEARRKPRTGSITLQSRHIGQSGTWTNPVACFVRNLAMRAMPARLHMQQLEEIFRFVC